jgi:RES domain
MSPDFNDLSPKFYGNVNDIIRKFDKSSIISSFDKNLILNKIANEHIPTNAFLQIMDSVNSKYPTRKNELFDSSKTKSIDQISKTFPNLYFDYDKNKKQIQITEENTNNSISIENVKDALFLNTIDSTLTFADCTNFINYLSLYPMLGYKHDVGKMVFDYIMNCQKKEIIGNKYYRIRTSTIQKQIQYTENEMFEPPFTMPKQNRFSAIGQNPLYLSEDLEIAKKEAGVISSTKYTYIELQIKRSFSLLDITENEIPLFKSCHTKADNPESNMHIEYLLPNYISDCAKINKFEGIIYRSIHSDIINNIVIYESSKRDFNILTLQGFNY